MNSKSTHLPNVPAFIQKVDKKSLEAAVHKYIFDQEYVEVFYGAADASVDAGSAKERSWNFLKNGMGQDITARQHWM